MKPALVDTDILSMFFKNNTAVVARFGEYLKNYEAMNLSIITYYEILSGLKHKDASKQLDCFLDFTRHNTVLPLTERSVTISAEIYAGLRKTGKPIDDVDILIAGVALADNLVLVTHNAEHFTRIHGLNVVDWSAE